MNQGFFSNSAKRMKQMVESGRREGAGRGFEEVKDATASNFAAAAA